MMSRLHVATSASCSSHHCHQRLQPGGGRQQPHDDDQQDQSGVQGTSPIYLEGVINGAGVLVLVDLGSTHNIIDINVACSIGL
jgi:hypothetical protein